MADVSTSAELCRKLIEAPPCTRSERSWRSLVPLGIARSRLRRCSRIAISRLRSSPRSRSSVSRRCRGRESYAELYEHGLRLMAAFLSESSKSERICAESEFSQLTRRPPRTWTTLCRSRRMMMARSVSACTLLTSHTLVREATEL